MKCPKCNEEMQIKKRDVSNNQKQGQEYKEYQRVLYWCEKDDVWLNLETPKP